MPKPPDENDKHKAGILPTNPFEGLVKVSPAGDPGSSQQQGDDTRKGATGEAPKEDPARARARAVLDTRWGWVKNRCEQGEDWFNAPPPQRKYLLEIQEEGMRYGMLPLGRVGMLAAAGGAGKSWALIQLALSVATGTPWLGTYPVPDGAAGPVLLAMGEEEEEELRRRIYYASRSMGLSRRDQALAAERILLLPLCGEPVSLTHSADDLRVLGSLDGTNETAFARELHVRLSESAVEWRLLILDPASRFAGPDVEVDNAAATRFVQALERLTNAPGNPTVLLSHHTTKTSRTGEKSGEATAARGSSALTDGVRWQANLDTSSESDSQLTFKVVKSNYGRFPPTPLALNRDKDNYGPLRPGLRAVKVSG